MAEYVPFNQDSHLEAFIQLNIEYLTWIFNQLDQRYQLDTVSMVGQTVPDGSTTTLNPT
ncbi:MAG: hypothetical protein PVJ38_04030 [Candidatus Bathyarchaeota archaeon]|jgi:hypothetical protein